MTPLTDDLMPREDLMPTPAELDAFYRRQQPVVSQGGPLQPVGKDGKPVPQKPLQPGQPQQVGVYPQQNGRTFYTMESDWFRGLSPDQQRQLIGSAVTPEGMSNAYIPGAPPIPLPQQQMPPQAQGPQIGVQLGDLARFYNQPRGP